MKCFAFFLVLAFAGVSFALPPDCYAKMRKDILEYERKVAFGGKLVLSSVEAAANDVLMRAKKNELRAAFDNPGSFPPSRNFLVSKPDIEKSEVFKIIRSMPKGAVLHAHDTAIVSAEYMYNNITYRDNLYVCEINDVVHLKFFSQPDKQCKWELLRKVRENPKRATDVNNKILKQLSMVIENPNAVYTDVNKAWDKFMNIFMFITPMLTYKPVFKDFFYRGLQELYDDNVMYIELRSTLPGLYDLSGKLCSEKEVVGIYQEVTERFKKDHPDFIGAKLIYAPIRNADRKQVSQYIQIAKDLIATYPNFVAGFDLVGQEDKGHTLQYFSDLLLKVDPNIRFFFHAGETNWYGASTDENLVDALLLNTRRIGHGYALAHHPFLLEAVRRLDIGIEVNPISNQVLSLVGDLRNHPARQLFTEEYPVVISNDDPGLWGSRALSYDFYEAFMALMSEYSDLRALKQLALNSIKYSSLSDAEKQHALALWENKWNRFVAFVGNNV